MCYLYIVYNVQKCAARELYAFANFGHMVATWLFCQDTRVLKIISHLKSLITPLAHMTRLHH